MAGKEETTGPAEGGSKRGLLILALAAASVLAAIGYRSWQSGADDPAAEASLPGAPSIEELRRLAEASEDDAQPWQELGFAEFERGEFRAAADAYRRAVAIDGDGAVLWSALGEALVMASQRDPLPQDALLAFRKAVELDPSDPRARYFLAVQRDLEGDHRGAVEDWLALLADTPPGAPWEGDLVRTIEQVGRINRIAVADRIDDAVDAREIVPLAASRALPGPTQDQLAAAGSIPPGEQREMAEGMVERLEKRLAGDPGNLEGWIMLMRSRMTLGQPERARAALDAAIRANPREAARLREEAETLGVG